MKEIIPETAIGVVAHGKDDLRVESLTRERPTSNEAVVHVAYGGICGSDLHYWLDGAAGESILREPLLLGHEVVGVVVEAATDGSGPDVGTPVAVHPATPGASDGSRFPADRPNLSPGSTYLGSAAHLPHTQGAFMEYTNLPTRMLRSIPAELPLRIAAVIEPASVAWHAVSRAGVVAGKRALVVGCGPIGALIVSILKRAGATEIIAVDMYDRPREIARAVGATFALDARDTDAIASANADIAFECSGNYRGLQSAMRGMIPGGKVVMVGLLPAGEQPALISLAIVRELELVGSYRFNDEIDDVIAALAEGSLLVDPIITHEYPVAEAIHAFDIARDAATSCKVLLRF
ncbi:MAG: L-idonate 5-dehydrogenase [Cryobacterium sp.]|nr:L-idonate 5-dehydrogenase [Cryobacterium sp.]